MANERVKAIQQRSKSGYFGTLRAGQDVDYLLAENEQLTKVVEAVKAYALVEYQGRIHDTPKEWQSVLDALAALPDTEAGE